MTKSIRIAGIVSESIVDGPGIRYTIFTQGCKHNCEGCHNPHTHSFEGGYRVNIEQIISEIMENPLLDGVTLSGGDPFEQAKELAELAHCLREKGYNIMTYTGYTYEYLIKNSSEINGWNELLLNTDILVDGRFELSKKNLKLKFRGSENQRMINMKSTKQMNKVIEMEL